MSTSVLEKTVPGIMTAPWTTRMPIYVPNGRVLTVHGLDEESGIVYAPDPSLELEPVPARPSQLDIDYARAFIDNEFFSGFEFATATDRAMAWACLLTPFGRGLYGGAPPFVITGDTPFCGETTLAMQISVVFNGDTTLSRMGSAADLEAILGSALSDHRDVVVVEPVDFAKVATRIVHYLGGLKGYADAADGERIWPMLVFAASSNGSVPPHFATVRLHPRTGGDGDRIAWTREHRSKIIRCAMTLFQAWIARGMPLAELNRSRRTPRSAQ